MGDGAFLSHYSTTLMVITSLTHMGLDSMTHIGKHCMTYTVSPRREATWLITEGGLSTEFTSHGLYGENVFQTTGLGGL